MVGGRVERVETVIFVFDLGSIGHDEPDLAKAAHDVVGDLRERVQLAERAAASRQGEVGRLLWQCGFKFEFVAARSERGFEFGFGLVDELAGGRTVFLRQRPEPFQQRGEFAVRADPVALGLFERSKVRRGFQLRERGLFQRFDFVQEQRHGIFLATKGRKRHKRNCQVRRFIFIPSGVFSTPVLAVAHKNSDSLERRINNRRYWGAS